jgi:DNA-binding CsgD family transcriptional regulator
LTPDRRHTRYLGAHNYAGPDRGDHDELNEAAVLHRREFIPLLLKIKREAGLTRQECRIFDLRIAKAKTNEEAAKLLGLAESTVSNAVRRILKKIRNQTDVGLKTAIIEEAGIEGLLDYYAIKHRR